MYKEAVSNSLISFNRPKRIDPRASSLPILCYIPPFAQGSETSEQKLCDG